MKVAFPYPGYWPYVRRGVERTIHDLAGYLAGRGHDVHVITSTPGRSKVVYEGKVRITYVCQLNHPLLYRYAPLARYYGFGVSATQVIYRDRPDAAHLWTFSGIRWARILRRRLGLPYLFHMIVAPLSVGRWIYPELRDANRTLALTELGKRQIEAEFGVPCEVLPPPVNLKIFRPCGPRTGHPTVFFPADLAERRKGGTLMLRAWNHIHRSEPRARLVLAGNLGVAGWIQDHGDGSTLSQLDLVLSASARKAVEVRGPGDLAALPSWYSAAWVTVLPSVDEAFGMTLTESLACGTPVVASHHGGSSEIISSPDIGRTVDILEESDLDSTARARELADAVLRTFELSRQSQTRTRCREWSARWSLERVGAQEERLLEEIVEAQVSNHTQRPLPSRVAQ